MDEAKKVDIKDYDMEYIISPEDEELYLKEIMSRRMKLSSRLQRRLKVRGGVFLNGIPAFSKQKGKAGDVLSVRFPEESSYFEPENIPLSVVYEDEVLLIIDKAPGIVIHPTKNHQSGTLANALAYRMEAEGRKYKVRFVNRLDRDTSGLVIVAKNSHCQDFISDRMERGEVEKVYYAVLRGEPQESEGIVDLPIDKDENHKARRKVTEGGYPSRTCYRIISRFEGFALAELRLETGRTHQIRVHMSHMGFPIAGDELYDDTWAGSEYSEHLLRQALHACALEFVHPLRGERLRMEAPMPGDIKYFLSLLRPLRL